MKRLLGSLFLITLVLAIGVVLVVYAQGNRFENGKLTGRGILQVDTSPNSARVFVNGEEKGESDTSIENLEPKTYTIRIEKDRYQTWEKQIEVKEGMVTPLSVSLFPSNPSLTSLTFDGVFSPTVSPDHKKVVYGIQTTTKKGLWVLNLTDRQLFFDNSSPRQIIADTETLNFSNSSFSWSPNSQQVLVTAQLTGSTETRSYLLEADRLNNPGEDVTNRIQSIQVDWETQKANSQTNLLNTLGKEAQTLAIGAKEVKFSKDENAVLIVKEDGTALVYDSKPSPVPNSKPQTYNLPKVDSYYWYYGDDKNILLVEKNTISISDTDGTNRVALFTGDFDPKAIFTWPDGSRIVISINLNSSSNPLPNLYSISLN